MSLALIQGYSSAEDDEREEKLLSSSSHSANENDEDDDLQALQRTPSSTASEKNTSFDLKLSSNSSLPSAFAAFAEVVGPPEFLNSSVVEGDKQDGERDGGRRGKGSGRRQKRELPPGVVLESKPQLVGIRDRVRSDIEASSPVITTGTVNGEGKRVFSASNPDAKDAADLLRMCLQCGIPKTYSHTRGVVCPVCSDRPLSDPLKEYEKKGSTVKDKERSKRMKGQSSHATWKSETEMQLRQQFD